MNRFLAGSILLLSSFTVAAQNGGAPVSQTSDVKIISIGCPVQMQAHQRGSSQLVEARNGQRSSTPGQRISLTLHSAQSSQITAARVRVHGLTPKGRVVQSNSTNPLASDTTRTMTVAFNEESNGGVTGELRLPGFTSVTSIGLEEITYASGTVWTVGSQQACTVTPDPFMLVSDR
jgi:hypothetical protein